MALKLSIRLTSCSIEAKFLGTIRMVKDNSQGTEHFLDGWKSSHSSACLMVSRICLDADVNSNTTSVRQVNRHLISGRGQVTYTSASSPSTSRLSSCVPVLTSQIAALPSSPAEIKVGLSDPVAKATLFVPPS